MHPQDSLLRQALARSNDDPIPRPIGLAVAIPHSEGAAFDSDLERLYREIHALSQCVDRDRDVVELVVDASEAAAPMARLPWAELLSAIEHLFHVVPSATRAIHLSALRRGLSAGDVAAIGTSGFNGLSLELPRADDGFVRTAHGYGIDSVAVALRWDPEEPRPQVLQQVDAVACFARPDRLELRPSGAADAASNGTSGQIRERLEKAGYEFIGPDQYALPTDSLAAAIRADSLRYGPFGYTATPDCDQLGIGPGAVSQVGAFRGRNARLPEDWRCEVDGGHLTANGGSELALEDLIRAEVRQQLLCRRMIMVDEMERGYDMEFRGHFARELAHVAQLPIREQIRDCGDRIEVRSPGWPWLRKIAACFDSHR